MIRQTGLLTVVLTIPIYAGTITINATCYLFDGTQPVTRTGDSCSVPDQLDAETDSNASAGAAGFITDLALAPTFNVTGELAVRTYSLSAGFSGTTASINMDVQEIFGTTGPARLGYLVFDTSEGSVLTAGEDADRMDY